jgi:hypothetical protein
MEGTSTRSTPRRPFAGARDRDGSWSERNRQLESKPLPARSDDNEVLEANGEWGSGARKGTSSTRRRLGPGEHLLFFAVRRSTRRFRSLPARRGRSLGSRGSRRFDGKPLNERRTPDAGENQHRPPQRSLRACGPFERRTSSLGSSIGRRARASLQPVMRGAHGACHARA